MTKLALIVALLLTTSAPAMADEVPWPKLEPGDVKVLAGDAVPALVREAAGFAAPAELPKDVKITAFMAAHRGEYLIVSPCCGKQGGGASFFAYVDGKLRSEALTVGDPRKGFTTQPFADSITVDPGAKALRARIEFSDCEAGVWGYYYQFDEIDRPQLVSAIDTSCAHLGVRELWHNKAGVGHWWQR